MSAVMRRAAGMVLHCRPGLDDGPTDHDEPVNAHVLRRAGHPGEADIGNWVLFAKVEKGNG